MNDHTKRDELLSSGVALIQRVTGRLICDPLTMDKPEAISSEIKKKAREALIEELEARGAISYSFEVREGVLYASMLAALPTKSSEESCKQKSIAEMKKVPQNLHS